MVFSVIDLDRAEQNMSDDFPVMFGDERNGRGSLRSQYIHQVGFGRPVERFKIYAPDRGKIS